MGKNQIYSLLPTRVLSRPWLVQIRLNLGFLQSIATAMDFGPAQRSTVSVPAPASGILVQYAG